MAHEENSVLLGCNAGSKADPAVGASAIAQSYGFDIVDIDCLTGEEIKIQITHFEAVRLARFFRLSPDFLSSEEFLDS